MQRLIDANALNFEKLNNTNGRAVPMNDYIAFFTGAIAAQEIVKNAPTIDAELVVHGHWVKRYKSKYYHCSVCGGLVEDEWHNCPHCRAKMDEEQR